MTEEKTTSTGRNSKCCVCYCSSYSSAVAIAKSSAYASAYAQAFVRLFSSIAIMISILVSVIAIAVAFSFASSIAISIASAVAVAIAIALAIAAAMAAARAMQALPLCSLSLDLPPTASDSDPLKPALTWETTGANIGGSRANIEMSADGGVSYSPLTIVGSTEATKLPSTGAFVWENATQSSIGSLLLIRAVAFNSSNVEICRSNHMAIRIIP